MQFDVISGHSLVLVGSYPFSEMKSVYSTSPAGWSTDFYSVVLFAYSNFVEALNWRATETNTFFSKVCLIKKIAIVHGVYNKFPDISCTCI